jgi:hypothetical protein
LDSDSLVEAAVLEVKWLEWQYGIIAALKSIIESYEELRIRSNSTKADRCSFIE